MLTGVALGERPGHGAGPRSETGALRAGGRYWDRTSDLFRVREARYRCANRPGGICASTRHRRGGYGIRTRVHGFAGRCLASRPTHRRCSRIYVKRRSRRDVECAAPGADDRIRTGDPHLGKVMLYQLSYVRMATVRGLRRGRYWDRTSDLFRVKEARYPCANRPKVLPPSTSTLPSGLEEAYMRSIGLDDHFRRDLHRAAPRRAERHPPPSLSPAPPDPSRPLLFLPDRLNRCPATSVPSHPLHASPLTRSERASERARRAHQVSQSAHLCSLPARRRPTAAPCTPRPTLRDL